MDAYTQAAQYGNLTKASAVYLSQYQLIPLDRVKEFFQDQAGIPMKGTVGKARELVSRLTTPYLCHKESP